MAVSILFAYLIAHTFIGVYSMAIDTMYVLADLHSPPLIKIVPRFLCFCEDCARNDGINKPYFMSRVTLYLSLVTLSLTRFVI